MDILEECKRLGINVSETVREALLQKLSYEKERKFAEAMEKASASAKKLTKASVVKEVRKMREEM